MWGSSNKVRIVGNGAQLSGYRSYGDIWVVDAGMLRNDSVEEHRGTLFSNTN